MNKALIVIDMQNDFITGALGSTEAQAIIPEVKKLVEIFHKNGDSIYYTQDTHYAADYPLSQEGIKLPVLHCVMGSWGWRIVDGVDFILGSAERPIYHLNKETFAYNDWEEENLDQYDEIWICGLVSSICVVSNALIIKGLYPELPIKFVSYASAGLSPENHAAAIEIMKSCQIEVI